MERVWLNPYRMGSLHGWPWAQKGTVCVEGFIQEAAQGRGLWHVLSLSSVCMAQATSNPMADMGGEVQPPTERNSVHSQNIELLYRSTGYSRKGQVATDFGFGDRGASVTTMQFCIVASRNFLPRNVDS